MTRSQATPASSQIITLERMLSEREIEIERLRDQVEVLNQTIEAARTAMSAAPAWHEMHRAAIDQLRAGTRDEGHQMHSDLLQGKDLTTGRLRLYRS